VPIGSPTPLSPPAQAPGEELPPARSDALAEVERALNELSGQVAGAPPSRGRGRVMDKVARVVAVGYLLVLLTAAIAYKGAFSALAVTPLLASYGLVVCGYIVSRFVLSAFYRPHRPAGLEPRVAIVMPAFNEQKAIAASLRSLLALDYPAAKLEIVAVNGERPGDPAAAL
jgi:hyaluronan synthase